MTTPQLFILPSHFNGQFFVEPSYTGPSLHSQQVERNGAKEQVEMTELSTKLAGVCQSEGTDKRPRSSEDEVAEVDPLDDTILGQQVNVRLLCKESAKKMHTIYRKSNLISALLQHSDRTQKQTISQQFIASVTRLSIIEDILKKVEEDMILASNTIEYRHVYDKEQEFFSRVDYVKDEYGDLLPWRDNRYYRAIKYATMSEIFDYASKHGITIQNDTATEASKTEWRQQINLLLSNDILQSDWDQFLDDITDPNKIINAYYFFAELMPFRGPHYFAAQQANSALEVYYREIKRKKR